MSAPPIPVTRPSGQPGFRFREPIFILLYLAGFVAPWERIGSQGTLWLRASTWIARTGWLSVADATITVTFAALACLTLGTVLRVWGTAYLGSAVMLGGGLQGDRLVAGGPYRILRNPLYLGSWLLALGTSIVMPASGALFFLTCFSLFCLYLIFAEERYLTANLGDTYREYRSRVPRLLPRIAIPPGSPVRPRWLQAIAAETFPLGFTACFAILAWRYNARIVAECLLICYGVSLVVRACTPR